MHKLLAIAAVVVATCTRAALAQDAGGVRGVIRFESAAPVAAALVWTVSGRTFRDTHTDSLGRFQLENLAVGSADVEVLCPGLNAALTVPVAVHRSVRIEARHLTAIDATVPVAVCAPLPTRDVHVHWRGSYSSGFELSAFYPCPADSLAREVLAYGHPFGRRAWVDWPPTVWRAPQLGTLGPDTLMGGVTGFVEWSGVLHGPASSGHMGMSNYRLTLDSIFTVAADGHC